MNNFLAMLDKLAQASPLTDGSVRVFKLENNPDQPENLPAPERLPASAPPAAQPGQAAFGRRRRPQP